MDVQTNPAVTDRARTRVVHQGASEAVYGLGFVGALIYYMQHAATLVTVVLGLLKAMVWPAMLVYKLLEMLKL